MVSLSALLGLWLMAVGVTQPGGAGTTIFIYSNGSAANGLYYTFAEISAAFPADFVDLGTTPASYSSAVDLQIGDVGAGTNTTTLQDTAVTVFFAANRCLFTRTTQPSSWQTLLGTKVGTGNTATGTNGCIIHAAPNVTRTIRGTIKCYGCTFILHTNHISWVLNPLVAGTGSELISCNFDARSNASFTIGTAASVGYSSIYDVSMASSGTTGPLGNIGSAAIERMILGTSTGDVCFRATSATGTIKDVAFFGAPSNAQVSLSGPTNWSIVRPLWISGVKKVVDAAFSVNAINEMWAWMPLVVDANGTPVSGIPVTMTDVFGTVVVNAVSGSDGRVTFGTGQLANMVTVLDYYGVAGITTVRQHGPFLIDVNSGQYRYYFSWPNASMCTNTSGQLDDFGDAIPMGFASGAPTSWVELTA